MTVLRFAAVAVLFTVIPAAAQDLPEYTCWKATGPIVVDGAASEDSWLLAAPMSLWDVRYIESPRPHSRPTEARMLWDADNLYVYFRCTDPDVWSVLTERDANLWEDEVVEIFFDPVGEQLNYAEYEVNPLNTVLDLLVTRVPSRQSFFEWSPPVSTAIQVGGTLNDHTDTDEYWSMEMALPWQSLVTDMTGLVGERGLPPRDGDIWHFNFYRYERLRNASGRETTIEYSAWSPTGEINFHRPDRFGVVQFRQTSTAVGARSWGQVKEEGRRAE
ncbi:MAG: carbohydrate-binding family 9-like protein [Candidatus Latescibacterota bacterium]